MTRSSAGVAYFAAPWARGELCSFRHLGRAVLAGEEAARQ